VDEAKYPITVEGLSNLQYLIEDATEALQAEQWTEEQVLQFSNFITSRDEYSQLPQDLIPELRLQKVSRLSALPKLDRLGY
jgi:hypothetical protein